MHSSGLYSPLNRVVGSAGSAVVMLVGVTYAVYDRGLTGYTMAFLVCGGAIFIWVIAWRAGIYHLGDRVVLRTDVRSIPLAHERVAAVEPHVEWDLYVIRRWAIRVEFIDRADTFDCLVGYSFFRGRNGRVDRQVVTLRRWLSVD